jgi:hypothetical protein
MLLGMLLYATGRLYFQLTGGFTIANISTDLAQEPDHGIAFLDSNSLAQVETLLRQPYRYLGKGCQSYVFLSDDGRYVLKFLKYQRFRPSLYLDAFSFIPSVETYRKRKIVAKRKKLDLLLKSWKIAYEHLKAETGVVYVHLNATDSFNNPIYITDKAGFKHAIDPNSVVFLLQRTAKMLCESIEEKMESGNLAGAKCLLDRLILTLRQEYERGFGDHDHALMQNTGVSEDQPIHIDVGQLDFDERFKDPAVYQEELFSKTFKFRIWLSKHYPELEQHLESRLYQMIGPRMATMKPRLKTLDEGA